MFKVNNKDTSTTPSIVKYFYLLTTKKYLSKEMNSPVPNYRVDLITGVGLQNLAKSLKARVSCLGQIRYLRKVNGW